MILCAGFLTDKDVFSLSRNISGGSTLIDSVDPMTQPAVDSFGNLLPLVSSSCSSALR